MDFDIMKVTPQDTEFSRDFTLTAQRDANLTAFVGYFDTYFNLPHQVYFSTGPHAPSTHWKQTIFYLPQLRPIKKGRTLESDSYQPKEAVGVSSKGVCFWWSLSPGLSTLRRLKNRLIASFFSDLFALLLVFHPFLITVSIHISANKDFNQC